MCCVVCIRSCVQRSARLPRVRLKQRRMSISCELSNLHYLLSDTIWKLTEPLWAARSGKADGMRSACVCVCMPCVWSPCGMFRRRGRQRVKSDALIWIKSFSLSVVGPSGALWEGGDDRVRRRASTLLWAVSCVCRMAPATAGRVGIFIGFCYFPFLKFLKFSPFCPPPFYVNRLIALQVTSDLGTVCRRNTSTMCRSVQHDSVYALLAAFILCMSGFTVHIWEAFQSYNMRLNTSAERPPGNWTCQKESERKWAQEKPFSLFNHMDLWQIMFAFWTKATTKSSLNI